MKNLFHRVIEIIPRFNITDPKIIPYGLKPHTRSVSWIVEQVIVQQAKYNRKYLDIKDVMFDLPDTSLHDCEILNLSNHRYYINIKITQARKRQSKNDISAVEKLYRQYSENENYRIIFVVFQFTFRNTEITFIKDKVHAFSPQFLPIYVNPRNDKIQAFYYADHQLRSRENFLKELKHQSRSISL